MISSDVNENWRDIKGYEGLYKVSDTGAIKSLPRNGTVNHERILKPKVDKDGYLTITLRKNDKPKTFRIHRIVAQSFIPNYHNKTQVNHIDGNKSNNNVNNLEWCTALENQRHAWVTGLQSKRFGEDNDKSKVVIQYTLNGEKIRKFNSCREVGRLLGYNHSCISACCTGRYKQSYGYIWKYENGGDVNE